MQDTAKQTTQPPTTPPATRAEAMAGLEYLRGFISGPQLTVIGQNCNGEEKQFFYDKLRDLAKMIREMPATYEQEGKGDAAIVHLHYFLGGSDWWITERDVSTEQVQAFGLVALHGNYPELGYIPIIELIQNRVEIDLYWDQKTLGEVRKQIDAR